MLYDETFHKRYTRKDNDDGEETIIKKLEKLTPKDSFHEIEIMELVLLKKQDQTNNLIDLLISHFKIKDLLNELSNWLLLQENRRNHIKKETDRTRILALL